MTAIIGEFRKGEDIVLALDAMTGDPSTVSAVTAAMRKVRFYGTGLTIEDGEPIAVTVTARAAQGNVPGGWTLLVPASVTRDLDLGTYGFDARLEIGSGVEITDQTAVINLSEAVLT